MSQITRALGADGFLPHGYCLLWRPDLLALHATSDTVIAVAYFSIPLAIFSFVRQRQDLIAEHRRIALLFCLFILGCGMTHVMGVVILWAPLYLLDGLIKAFTALVSIFTAVLLWPVIPRLLAIPSPGELARANTQLQAEVAAKLEALGALESIRTDLEAEVERRMRENDSLARRFLIATEGSTITVAEQDDALRYVWLHNPTPPFSEAAIGKTDADLLEPSVAEALNAAKQLALDTGTPTRTTVAIPLQGDRRHFELRITPTVLAQNRRGLLIASIDTTAQQRQQEHLQTLLRELAHRAKNLLSLVEGVARQTAKAEGLSDSFIKRFSARLAALGSAYDLLIGQDWKGASLEALVRAQLAFLLPEAGERLSISGPAVTVAPQVSQYLSLAIHELATNATKHGVLSRAEGEVEIIWTIEPGEAGMVALTWRERGSASEAPVRRGFGRLLLETLAPRALSGEAELAFTADGMSWSLRFQA